MDVMLMVVWMGWEGWDKWSNDEVVGVVGFFDVDGIFVMEKCGMDVGRCFFVGRLLFFSFCDWLYVVLVW